MSEINVEIFWNDLSPEKQRDIADLMEIDVEEVVKHTNWDVIPLATLPLGEGD